jgi:hypothetical protein
MEEKMRRAIAKISRVMTTPEDNRGVSTIYIADPPGPPEPFSEDKARLQKMMGRPMPVIESITVETPPDGAFWNGIARAWFVDVDGEAIRIDPQPPAPGVHGVVPSPRIDL